MSGITMENDLIVQSMHRVEILHALKELAIRQRKCFYWQALIDLLKDNRSVFQIPMMKHLIIDINEARSEAGTWIDNRTKVAELSEKECHFFRETENLANEIIEEKVSKGNLELVY